VPVPRSWLTPALPLLFLALWLGGIVYFSSALAPVAFSVLPPSLAGHVVSPALHRLHFHGLLAGILYLLWTLVRGQHFGAAPRTRILLILLALTLTATSEFQITPRIAAARAAAGADLSEPALGPDEAAARRRFDQLHVWSVGLELGTLVSLLTLFGLSATSTKPD